MNYSIKKVTAEFLKLKNLKNLVMDYFALSLSSSASSASARIVE